MPPCTPHSSSVSVPIESAGLHHLRIDKSVQSHTTVHMSQLRKDSQLGTSRPAARHRRAAQRPPYAHKEAADQLRKNCVASDNSNRGVCGERWSKHTTGAYVIRQPVAKVVTASRHAWSRIGQHRIHASSFDDPQAHRKHFHVANARVCSNASGVCTSVLMLLAAQQQSHA